MHKHNISKVHMGEGVPFEGTNENFCSVCTEISVDNLAPPYSPLPCKSIPPSLVILFFNQLAIA